MSTASSSPSVPSPPSTASATPSCVTLHPNCSPADTPVDTLHCQHHLLQCALSSQTQGHRYQHHRRHLHPHRRHQHHHRLLRLHRASALTSHLSASAVSRQLSATPSCITVSNASSLSLEFGGHLVNE